MGVVALLIGLLCALSSASKGLLSRVLHISGGAFRCFNGIVEPSGKTLGCVFRARRILYAGNRVVDAFLCRIFKITMTTLQLIGGIGVGFGGRFGTIRRLLAS